MKSEVISRFHARWASSKITTRSGGGRVILETGIPEVVNILDECLYGLLETPFRVLPSGAVARELVSGKGLTVGRRRAGRCQTKTPRAWAGAIVYGGDVETNQVFPAPGTPVTKMMALFPLARTSSTTFSMHSEVSWRLRTPASCRAMASTEWPANIACAASIIVGVGQYCDWPQVIPSSVGPVRHSSPPRINRRRPSRPQSAGLDTPSA